MSLEVFLCLGAGVILQPDVQAGVDLTFLPLITPAEEVETCVLSSTCQPPSKMTDLRDKKMHLDLILRNVRTRWKESQKLKSHWEPSKIIKREINNAWHQKMTRYNLNENIWNRTKDNKSQKYVKYLLQSSQKEKKRKERKKLTVKTAKINFQIFWNVRTGIASKIAIFCRDITVGLIIASRKW